MNLVKEDLLGIQKDRMKMGASLADVDPMHIDRTVSCIYGLMDAKTERIKIHWNYSEKLTGRAMTVHINMCVVQTEKIITLWLPYRFVLTALEGWVDTSQLWRRWWYSLCSTQKSLRGSTYSHPGNNVFMNKRRWHAAGHPLIICLHWEIVNDVKCCSNLPVTCAFGLVFCFSHFVVECLIWVYLLKNIPKRLW